MSDAAAEIALRSEPRLRLAEISDRLGGLLDRAMEADVLAASDIFAIMDWIRPFEVHDRDGLGMLLASLLIAFEEGSLSVELSPASLCRRLVDLGEATALEAWGAEALAVLASGRFASLVGTRLDAHRPIVLHESNGTRHLYFQKYLRAELDFRDAFLRLLGAGADSGDAGERLAATLEDVLQRRPLRTGHGPLEMDREQKFALGLALTRPLTLVSGGPGTGKTSIVLNLLRCLVREGTTPDCIALAAPTGRAAQRLTDSIRAGLDRLSPPADSPDAPLREITASTLHKLLSYDPSRQIYYRHRENPIPADFVIIDETSMVGVVQLASLLQALRPGCRLILLGDKDQLPSVDAGAILAQLTEGTESPSLSAAMGKRLASLFPEEAAPPVGEATLLRDAFMLLKTNHRSQSAIRDAAAAVNAQDASILDRLPRLDWSGAETEGGCWWCEQTAGEPAELRRLLEAWAEHAYFKPGPGGRSMRDVLADSALADLAFDAAASPPALEEAFRLLDRTRLLTLIREGPWGCDDINRFFDELLRPRLDRGAVQGKLFAGCPVLVTRNDAGRQLNNGDVGLAIRSRRGDLRVVFPRQGGHVAFAAESLPSHELGFAMTVHKSQGSEFDHVMVVFPPRGGRRLLTKELLYTAMTRARRLAILAGKRESLELAIRRRIVRESGLDWRRPPTAET